MRISIINIFHLDNLELSSNARFHYIHSIIKYHQTLQDARKEQAYYPFNSYSQYILAKIFIIPRIANAQLINTIAMKGHKHDFLHERTSFRSMKEFHSHLDMIMETQCQ